MLDGTPGWELKIRFWIENPHGRVVLGPGRIELMELIASVVGAGLLS